MPNTAFRAAPNTAFGLAEHSVCLHRTHPGKGKARTQPKHTFPKHPNTEHKTLEHSVWAILRTSSNCLPVHPKHRSTRGPYTYSKLRPRTGEHMEFEKAQPLGLSGCPVCSTPSTFDVYVRTDAWSRMKVEMLRGKLN